jgi:hypothetical protein
MKSAAAMIGYFALIFCFGCESQEVVQEPLSLQKKVWKQESKVVKIEGVVEKVHSRIHHAVEAID